MVGFSCPGLFHGLLKHILASDLMDNVYRLSMSRPDASQGG